MKKLRKIIQTDEHFKKLDWETAELLEIFSGKKLNLMPKGGAVDMCKAMDEWEEEAIAKGEKIGEVKGERNGDLKRAKKVAENMFHKGYALEEAAELIECDINLLREWWDTFQSA